MNLAKFHNLVLRICEAVPEKLTTTRLNKLIWLIDKTAFLATGQKITGCRYLRKQYGPVPMHNGDALALMGDRGLIDIHLYKGDDYAPPRREYVSSCVADNSVFNAVEQQIIAEVLAEYADWSAHRLVRLSHDLVWANREDGEEINFEAYLVKFNLSPEQKRVVLGCIEQAELAYEE